MPILPLKSAVPSLPRSSWHHHLLALTALVLLAPPHLTAADITTPLPIRVFLFGGQSNMEGADSHVEAIQEFPPFVGLAEPQPEVLFSYSIGRQNKRESDGWVPLQPVGTMVGPELSFARELTRASEGPIAIIKCAAGGTHLGGDWNPDQPSGFQMYPLMLKRVRASLAELDRQGRPYQLEAFFWHQGENDMFEASYQRNYGTNLRRFIERWRQDLQAPELPFYVGELCTKTIWGMDLRPRMYAISLGQKDVAAADPLTHYVRTSHVGVEIGNPVGLHYHYGTLGQLEHGVNYAEAYLRSIGNRRPYRQALKQWPYPKEATVNLFILAGHRNMEGERAFTQTLESSGASQRDLLKANPKIAYQYDLGGGIRTSATWEALRPVGYYDTFGPELSFGAHLAADTDEPIAIAKFTHSGSQVIDWTPEGSMAKSRNLYPAFIQFIQRQIHDLETRGHTVRVAGIFYHLGENDMSFGPYRREAAKRLEAIISESRKDLALPHLTWYVSQQKPTDNPDLNKIDVVQDIANLANRDPQLIHVKVFDLPEQDRRLVLDTAAILELGKQLAEAYQQGP